MGIELPAEFADLAARAGVHWPEADEDAMRAQAEAWRATAERLQTLAAEADSLAQEALGALDGSEGGTAQAARRYWDGFVAPGTGHLPALVRDCHAAADRLEHAAEQVGAAKVEIVRQLVGLARHRDVAEQAAAAGHPTALLGLETVARAVAANVAALNDTLASAVTLGSGVVVGDAPRPAQPAGAGGTGGPTVGSGLLDTVSRAVDTVTHTVDAVTHTVGGTSETAPGAEDTGPIAAAVGHVVDGAAQQVAAVADRAPEAAEGDGSEGLGHTPSVSGTTADADPERTGPVAVDQVLPDATRTDRWTVEETIRTTPGGVAVPMTGAPAEPPRQVHQVQQMWAAAPAMPGVEPVVGGPGEVLPGAVAPGGPAQPAGPVGGVPASPGGAGPGFLPGGPGVMPGAPGVPGGGTGAAAPHPGAALRADATALRPRHAPTVWAGGYPAATAWPCPGQPQPFAQPAPVHPPAPAVPPGPHQDVAPGGRQPGAPAASDVAAAREQVVAMFLMYLFPIGHLPKPSARPTRQLPAPPPELDLAAGLRFPPQDHPDSALVDDRQALERVCSGAPAPRPGVPRDGDDRVVRALLAGHEPLPDTSSPDWQRRFQVRPADPDSGQRAEYAWPPAEMFPEGAADPKGSTPQVLEPGTEIDRFGSPEGRVLFTAGTPFPQRSLPPEYLDHGYHRYRVLRPLPVWRAVTAPWFGQPGGGERYRTTYPVADLVALGYLQDITGEEVTG